MFRFFAFATLLIISALGCGKTSMTTEIGTASDTILETLTVNVYSVDVTDGMITAFDAYYLVEDDVEQGSVGSELAIITVKLAETVPVGQIITVKLGQLKLENSIHIAVLEKDRDFWTAVILTDIETDSPTIPVLEPLPAIP